MSQVTQKTYDFDATRQYLFDLIRHYGLEDLEDRAREFGEWVQDEEGGYLRGYTLLWGIIAQLPMDRLLDELRSELPPHTTNEELLWQLSGALFELRNY